MSHLSERPFFIIGNPRSGTTLLRFMLNSHPRLFAPEETGFIPFLQVDPAADLTQEQVAAVLTRIGRLNRYWQGMVPDVIAFYKSLPSHRLADVLDALYCQKLAEHGGQRWGDKTPGYVNYIPELARIFLSAQFIHIVRDGRDASLSAQNKWGRNRWYMDNYYLMQNWTQGIRQAQQAGAHLGAARYHELQYEALVSNPKEELGRVCAFLGEEMVPAMLDHSQAARGYRGPDVTDEVQKPVSTASIERWRSEMSAFEKKMADRVAGPTLAALGYPPGPAEPWSMVDRLKLLTLSGKFRLVQSTRRLLYAGGWLTLNRGRRS